MFSSFCLYGSNQFPMVFIVELGLPQLCFMSSNVSFTVMSIDAMDVSGENQIDVDHHLFKQRLTLSGQLVEDEPEKHEGQGSSL